MKILLRRLIGYGLSKYIPVGCAPGSINAYTATFVDGARYFIVFGIINGTAYLQITRTIVNAHILCFAIKTAFFVNDSIQGDISRIILRNKNVIHTA